MIIQSQVIISTDTESVISKLQDISKDDDRFIVIAKDGSFLMEDASLAIEKAYLSSKERVIIVLSAKQFSKEVQSKLLKILEEPPRNKEFILIMPSKSMVLPTIRSRLPVIKLDKDESDNIETEVDVNTLESKMIFEFIKNNRYTSSAQLSVKLQKIFADAMKSPLYNIDENTLNLFSNIIKLLDKGSPVDFVASTALLKLLSIKKRR